MRRTRSLRTSVLLVGALVAGGCVTATVEQRRMRPVAEVFDDDRIVVIGRRHDAEYETTHDFVDCIHAALARYGFALMDEKEFADWLYPWFEPRTAPMTASDLAERLEDRAIARRLEETRIRYLVWIDGVTRDGDEGGGIVCGVGPFGSCLGLMWWQDNAAYEASVWDLGALASMGRITVDASGTSYVPAVMVPVPLIARTDAAACSGLAAQLEEFLVRTEGPGDTRP
jgi:hypothetical protein